MCSCSWFTGDGYAGEAPLWALKKMHKANMHFFLYVIQ